jgi:hypothetical protein
LLAASAAAAAEPSLIALVNVSTPLAALLKPTNFTRYYSCSFSELLLSSG